MNVTIEPSIANGNVKAQPSKSVVHRLLICAALANGESIVNNVAFSEDILATLDCIRALGATVNVTKADGFGAVQILGIGGTCEKQAVDLPCRESGSTMRFFMGIVLGLGIRARFFGSGRLLQRPFDVYEKICKQQGICFLRNQDHILIDGKLKPSVFEIPGNISSQFVTGLLFALPLLDGESRIVLLPPIESRSYIDLTLDALKAFGITCTDLTVFGKQSYCGNTITAEGDYSNAAFLDAFNLLGGQVSVTGLKEDSRQGDRIYRQYFDALQKEDATLDLSDCPDLAPVLFVLAALLHGGTFTGTARLAIKESDRGLVMCEELAKCGVPSRREENRIMIKKSELHAPAEPLCGHNDHRIVMSLSVLLTRLGGTITGAEAVQKSYPSFFEDLKRLGILVSQA